MRIDDPAALVLGDGVDREVAAQKILLERDAGVGVELEAVIAGTRVIADDTRRLRWATMRR